MHIVDRKPLILDVISSKYVPRGLIHNKAMLVQIMIWRQTIIWTKLVQLVQFTYAYMRQSEELTYVRQGYYPLYDCSYISEGGLKDYG